MTLKFGIKLGPGGLPVKSEKILTQSILVMFRLSFGESGRLELFRVREEVTDLSTTECSGSQ